VPAPVSAPAKTVGTPVVHGKTATASADDDATPPAAKKTAKAPTRTELASVDDTPARSARKSAAKDEDADATPARSIKAKAAGTSAKAKTATADDDADCAPAPAPAAKGKGRHARPVAKKTPSTTCTQLATADDDGARTKKGAKSKASSVDDADDARARATKSGKSAKAADKTASGKATSEKAGAERVYVQVAGGANRDDMDKAWAGVKKKAPELMKGRTPSTTPLKATNRLLVGPFKDESEAQAFVNKMAAKGLSGFTFKSGKGQKVEKVDAGP